MEYSEGYNSMKKLIITGLILLFAAGLYSAQTTVNTSSDTFKTAWDRQQAMNTEIYADKHSQNSDTGMGVLGTKATPIDADKVVQRDSADSDNMVTSSWTQIKAFLKTYFDTLYQAADALLADIAALTDPGADRGLFWDDSAGNLGWLTFGTRLTVSDTTINVDTEVSDNSVATGWNGVTTISGSKNALHDYFVISDTDLDGYPDKIGSPAFDGALGTDDTYTGFLITGKNAGEAISQWDVVYFDATATEWLQADADAAGEFPARGIAVAAGTDGNSLDVIVQGTVRNDAWNWTVGGTIYLSDTAGGLTQTAPSTSGDAVQILGWAITADIIYVNCSGHWVEVE